MLIAKAKFLHEDGEYQFKHILEPDDESSEESNDTALHSPQVF